MPVVIAEEYYFFKCNVFPKVLVMSTFAFNVFLRLFLHQNI